MLTSDAVLLPSDLPSTILGTPSTAVCQITCYSHQGISRVVHIQLMARVVHTKEEVKSVPSFCGVRPPSSPQCISKFVRINSANEVVPAKRSPSQVQASVKLHQMSCISFCFPLLSSPFQSHPHNYQASALNAFISDSVHIMKLTLHNSCW